MSRLSDSSIRIRTQLSTRNLYTPNDPYRIDEGALAKTINKVASFVKPFDSVDVSNTFAGRIVGPRTPIVEIGLIMLGKQFLATSKSFGLAEFLPQIDPIGALFGGKLFTFPVDWQITRREGQTGLGKILEEISGVQDTSYQFSTNSAINSNYQQGDQLVTSNAANINYLKNSGFGQQDKLVQNISRNLYGNTNAGWMQALIDEGHNQYIKLIARKYFVDRNDNLTPFDQYIIEGDSAELNKTLNDEIVDFKTSITRNSTLGGFYEYGSSQGFLDGFGISYKKIINLDGNAGRGNVIIDNFGLNDDPNNRIIWGRDGISNTYKSIKEALDQNPNANPEGAEGVSTIKGYDGNSRFDTFGAKFGLLNYTKELLNSKGKYGTFDLTKKKFSKRGSDELLYNGSPLTRNLQGDNGGEIDRSRQHNVTDPYNRFVKAIRYNGNKIYNPAGGENSVINRTVIPKIHPVLDNGALGGVNNRNMMFSLENLAAEVFVDETNNVAYLDDQFGTIIPFCEAGAHGGRLMWFAPYDIKLTEQIMSRHETTTFLGRGEPIYTYNHSERLATLSFKLIIDYPPQARGRNHDETSRFFAFGDTEEPLPPNPPANDVEKVEEKEEEEEDTKEEVIVEDIPVNPPDALFFYFPNDEPAIGGEAGAIQGIIDNGYEDGNDDGTEYGGATDYKKNMSFIDDRFNLDIIVDMLGEEKRNKVTVDINGNTTTLFNGTNETPSDYNQKLGQRRADAMKLYLEDKYKEKYSRTVAQDNITINPTSGGLDDASSDTSNDTSTASSIPNEAAKGYRNVEITVRQVASDETVERVNKEEDIDYKKNLKEERKDVEERARNKAKNNKPFPCEYTEHKIHDNPIKGFEGFEKDFKFQNVFHSQTPEDFHRRLTFLHQCARQGEAIRKTVESSDGTVSQGSRNSVFGRQPVQILRLGDFFHTKIIIDHITIEYGDAPWDMNPEGMGMQYMYADITLQFKVIGGQSLREPIDAIQNATTFNYYANSTFYNHGIYGTPTAVETIQTQINNGETDKIIPPQNDFKTLRNANKTEQ